MPIQQAQGKQKITPCLWFDTEGEGAAKFYVSIFENSKIAQVTHYGEAGKEVHGHKPGSVLTVLFQLNGQEFMALNGGPNFKFTEAVSLMIPCDTQEEIDYYWGKLSADPNAEVCGWLKDKYGLSWQVAPTNFGELLGDPNSEKSQRAMAAMMQMKKLDIAKLQKAYDGQ
jgi:predicted 3-demethylubiquinone-9 3-methyltransferase (glyoxalase superfamily)